MGLEPDMNDPDWDRYLVQHGKLPPVGDPTRWGAEIYTNVLLTASGANVQTGQILQIATQDKYARSWSLMGTLGMLEDAWNGAPPGKGSTYQAYLDVTMGVGQVNITHRIVLSKFDSNNNYKGIGLCQTQHIGADYPGAPYQLLGETIRLPDGSTTPGQSRAFAIVGGLVGQSLSARALFVILPAAGGISYISRLSLIATPYAAGEGL